MERYDLPEGWEWKRLGDKQYFVVIMGQSPPSSSYNLNGIGLTFFQGKAEFGALHPVAKKFCTTPSRIAEKDDVLISVRAPVGPTNLADQKCCIGRGLAAIRCKVKVLPLYLLHALRNIENDIAASVQDQGGGFTAIKREQLENIGIPIPPLSEQRRIVKRIEELTRRVEEISRLRNEAVKEAENYIPAAIASVFGDGQNHGWVTKKISAICEKPQYGYTESAQNEAIGPKFLRITDIQDGKVDWDKVPYCKCVDVDKYRLGTGDIVFARTGATTGKSYLIKNPPKAVFASYLIRLSVGASIFPEFLYWYFQSSTYWTSVSSGIDEGNRPNMNGTKLANIEVSYPEDKAEQRRIVEYLNNLQRRAEALKQLQAETATELAAFTPAVLSKAFRGEL